MAEPLLLSATEATTPTMLIAPPLISHPSRRRRSPGERRQSTISRITQERLSRANVKNRPNDTIEPSLEPEPLNCVSSPDESDVDTSISERSDVLEGDHGDEAHCQYDV